jgi:hypothetical protein
MTAWSTFPASHEFGHDVDTYDGAGLTGIEITSDWAGSPSTLRVRGVADVSPPEMSRSQTWMANISR